MKRPRAPSKQSRKTPQKKKTRSASPRTGNNPQSKRSGTNNNNKTTNKALMKKTTPTKEQIPSQELGGSDRKGRSPRPSPVKRQTQEESGEKTAGKPLAKRSNARTPHAGNSQSLSASDDDENEVMSASPTTNDGDSLATPALLPPSRTTTAQGSPTPAPRGPPSSSAPSSVNSEESGANGNAMARNLSHSTDTPRIHHNHPHDVMRSGGVSSVGNGSGGELEEEQLLKSFDAAVAKKASVLASIKESMAKSAAKEESVRSLLQRRIVAHAQMDVIEHEMKNSDELVQLNVGGEHFTIPRRTLVSRDPDSYFNHLLNAGAHGSQIPRFKDSTGALFIDRDPKVFRYVLNYLRGYKRFRMLSSEMLDLIKADAQYYQLDGLLKLLQGLMPPLHTQFHTGPGVNPERNRIRVVYGVSFVGERFLISGKHHITYEIQRSDYVGIGIVSDACKYTDQEFHKTPNCCVYYMTGVFYTNFPHHKKEEFLQKLENGDFISLAVDMDKRVAEITLKGSSKVFSLGNSQRVRFAVVMKLGSRVRIVPEEEAAKLPMIRKKYFPHLCDSTTADNTTTEADSGTSENRTTDETARTAAINIAGESESQRQQIGSSQLRPATALSFPERDSIITQGVTPPATPATAAAPFDPFGIPPMLPESGRTAGGSSVAYGIPLSVQVQARVRPSPTTLPRMATRPSFASFEGPFGGVHIRPPVSRTPGPSSSTTAVRTSGDNGEQSRQQVQRGTLDPSGAPRARGALPVSSPDNALNTMALQQRSDEMSSLDLFSGRRAVGDVPPGVRIRDATNNHLATSVEQRQSQSQSQSQSQPRSQGAEGARSNQTLATPPNRTDLSANTTGRLPGRPPTFQGFLGGSNALQYPFSRMVDEQNPPSAGSVMQGSGERTGSGSGGNVVGVPTAMSAQEGIHESTIQADNSQPPTTTPSGTGDGSAPPVVFRTANDLAGEEEESETETLWLPVPPRSSRPS